MEPYILGTSAAETIFSESIQKMFPAFVAGIFLCAILAAAMSTADSQLLVASSAFSHDIYKGIVKKNMKAIIVFVFLTKLCQLSEKNWLL